jgi:flagellar biosynthesis chaperone FliJ
LSQVENYEKLIYGLNEEISTLKNTSSSLQEQIEFKRNQVLHHKQEYN